jgi:hypothetical protein
VERDAGRATSRTLEASFVYLESGSINATSGTMLWTIFLRSLQQGIMRKTFVKNSQTVFKTANHQQKH